ncbi:MAG TPA: hypothetical protein VHN78_08320, partial [Chloroflexota bacterium]|nr:hypothetical protein [Chloroflexota bacterium]
RALLDQADFVPTLLDVCGIAPAPRSQAWDGTSAGAVLADPSCAGKAAAFGEFALTRRPFYMRRERRWKYIYYTGPAGEADPSDSSDPAPLEALYDPAADPGELTNLAADPAAAPLVAEQRERLLAFLRQQGVSDPAHPPLASPLV